MKKAVNYQEGNSRVQQEGRRRKSRKFSASSIMDIWSTSVSTATTTQPCSTPDGSHSVTDLLSFNGSNTTISLPLEVKTTLKRSRTAPSKRNKFGEHEPQQVVYVNDNKDTINKSTTSCKRHK
jgi:hypothetical protein